MKKKRFVIYARVSTSLEGQITSFDTQINDLKEAFIKSHPDCECVGVYSDYGISGTKGKEKRPEFDRMLEDAQAKKFDFIVTKNLSRVARKLLVLADTIEILNKAKVGLVLLEEGFDTRRKSDRTMIALMGVLAESEARSLREHIQASYAIKRQNNVPARPSAVCYGYKLVENSDTGKKEVVIDEQESRVIKDIFKWFVEDGLSAGTIANKLTYSGIEAPRNHKSNGKKVSKAWHRSSVKYILKNPKYMGLIVEHQLENREIVNTFKIEDKWPAIISEERFEAAKRIMGDYENTPKAKKMRAYKSNFAPHLYPLSGLCYCGKCGMKTTRYSAHNGMHKQLDYEDPTKGGGNPLWGCLNGRFGKNHESHCDNYRISEEYLYEMIIEALTYALLNTNYIGDYLKKIESLQTEEIAYEEAMKKYNSDMKKYKKEYDNYVQMCAEGLIEKADLYAKKAEYDSKMKKRQATKPIPPEFDRGYLNKALKQLAENDFDGLTHHIFVSDRLQKLFRDPDSKRAIVMAVVERIEIGGEPRFCARIKLRGFDKQIVLRVAKRSPYLRYVSRDGKLVPKVHREKIHLSVEG